MFRGVLAHTEGSMAEYETIRRAGAGAGTAQIDEGLRSHMSRVYGLMAVAMVITGLVAWIVGSDFARAAALDQLNAGFR